MAGTLRSSTARGADLAPDEAAVRLLDEHERRVVVLKLDAVSHEAPPDSPSGRSGRAAGGPRRRLRALALALMVLGTLALADAVVTLVWQEPFSALYAKLRQDHLSGALRKAERAPPTPVEQRALARLGSERARIAFLAASLQRRARDGSPVGRIRIPSIGASFVVVNGTSTSALESGPGVLPETVFPGRGGTTAIAGHRTTYLAPFRHIDELRRGDAITLEMPYAHFTYAVTGSAIVAPTDVHPAVAYVGYSRLVLSACTPLFSAAKRLLVFARLQRTTPVQGGQALPHASSHAAQPSTPPRALTSGARTRTAPPPPRARPTATRPAGPRPPRRSS
jgi:sortase A